MIWIKLFKQAMVFNSLTYLLLVLIGFVGVVVGSFSNRYLKGDSRKKQFYFWFVLCLLAMMVWVSSNHFTLFVMSWAFANFCLVQLMGHKEKWQAAKASSFLALRVFSLSCICLSLGLFLLYKTSHCIYLTEISQISLGRVQWAALFFILLAACMQSGLYPFHSWLTSSLNSPTPVSAMMHAGLVNGGGILLTRFAPLYLKMPFFLGVILVAGLTSALIGTLWKLLQTDIKRLLACSTLGQMGFMFVQCGLGLFPAAVAHLFFHGLFKSYLFLNSASAAKKPKFESLPTKNTFSFIFGLFNACVGAVFFALVSKKSIYPLNSNLILIFVAFLAAFQVATVFIQHLSFKSFLILPLLMMGIGGLYGLNVFVIERSLEPLDLAHPQAFGILHGLSLSLMFLFWLLFEWREKKELQPFLTRIYVSALNASQPSKSTVTLNKNNYTYQ